MVVFNDSSLLSEGQILEGKYHRYKVGKLIGKGSSARVFSGINLDDGTKVAMKIEYAQNGSARMQHEFSMYHTLEGLSGVPKIYEICKKNEDAIIVMEYLGPSLEWLFKYCNKRFSVKTVCMIGKRMVSLIRSVHNRGLIFRDIKPENFLIGNIPGAVEPSPINGASTHYELNKHLSITSVRMSSDESSNGSKQNVKEIEKKFNTNGVDINSSFYDHSRNNSVYSLVDSPSVKDKSSIQSFGRSGFIVNHEDPLLFPLQIKAASQIYIMDFGLAENYRDTKTNVHKPRNLRLPCGTPRFMSRNTHLCEQQSRRDDLESIGYVLIYFLCRGRLPWQGYKADTMEELISKIWAKKSKISIEKLCKGYPKQFEMYLRYVRNLGFTETPNYQYLINLFDQVLEDNGEVDDGMFDWILRGSEGYVVPRIRRSKRSSITKWCKGIWSSISKRIDVY